MRRPSPSLVISVIALFVALGGTGYAAITVTSKNVKNNSLKGKDVKNSSLTGKDVKANSLTGSDVKSLGSGDVTDGSLTGADISESSLAKVGSATSADSANAATNAGNANSVGGIVIRKFRYHTAGADGTQRQLFTLGGLRLTASCAGSVLDVQARTSVNDAIVHSLHVDYNRQTGGDSFVDSGGDTVNIPGLNYQAAYEEEEDDLDVGESFDLDAGDDLDSDEGQLTYVTPAGAVVHAEFLGEHDAGCDFAGIVYSG
jgi:hypothetical protein